MDEFFWDIRLDVTLNGRLNLGVCTDSCNMNAYIGNDQHGWSVYGNTGKSEHKSQSNVYGQPFVQGDVIRVMVDMDSRTLAFERNGQSLGIAHYNLCDRVWPAFSLYCTKDTISLTDFGTF